MELEIKVSEKELNIIFAGLQELPAKIANPLTKKLYEQVEHLISKPEDR